MFWCFGGGFLDLGVRTVGSGCKNLGAFNVHTADIRQISKENVLRCSLALSVTLTHILHTCAHSASFDGQIHERGHWKEVAR